jgi:hypothetical protein
MSVHSFQEATMHIHKVFEFLVLWSEAQDQVESDGDWIVDWRWLATQPDEEASFTSECTLIH